MRTPIAAAVASTLLVMAASVAAQPATPLRIGVLTDLSGVVSDATGKGSVEAAKIAAEEAGGEVLGRKIEVLAADHQHKADLGASLARRWYDVDGVEVIVDVPNSSVALAVQNLAREKKKLVLITSAGTTAISEEQCSPYGVQWAYTTYALAHGTASAVVKNGNKTWFTIASDYAFGRQLANDVAQVVVANGGKSLGTVYHPLNPSDFASFLMQAQASKAQIIAIANAGGDTIAAIRQAAEFGIGQDDKQKLAAMLLLETDVHSLGVQVAQGTFLTVPSYWNADEGTRAFAKKFTERLGKAPTFLQTSVYGSVKHYLKSVKAAGNSQAETVMAQMKQLPIDDAFSTNAHIRADGLVVRDMLLAQVKKPGESKTPWDYYNIVAKIPGDQLVWPLSASKCPMVNAPKGS